MQLNGIVTNAADGTPITKAEVLLRSESHVIGKFYTDEDGAFYVSDATNQLVGKSLICEVAREAFEAQTVQRAITSGVVSLKIELKPIREVERPAEVPQRARIDWRVPAGGLVGAAIASNLMHLPIDSHQYKATFVLLAVAGALAMGAYYRRRGAHLLFQVSHAALCLGLSFGDWIARETWSDLNLRYVNVVDLYLLAWAYGAVPGALVVAVKRSGLKGQVRY